MLLFSIFERWNVNRKSEHVWQIYVFFFLNCLLRCTIILFSMKTPITLTRWLISCFGISIAFNISQVQFDFMFSQIPYLSIMLRRIISLLIVLFNRRMYWYRANRNSVVNQWHLIFEVVSSINYCYVIVLPLYQSRLLVGTRCQKQLNEVHIKVKT